MKRIHRGFGRLGGEIVGADPAVLPRPLSAGLSRPPTVMLHSRVDKRRRGDRIIAWSQRRHHIEKDVERRRAGRDIRPEYRAPTFAARKPACHSPLLVIAASASSACRSFSSLACSAKVATCSRVATSCSSIRLAEYAEQWNRLVDRQVRVSVGARRDRRIEARVELEPHQHPPNRFEAVARHDAQMVSGVVGDAGGKRDLDVPVERSDGRSQSRRCNSRFMRTVMAMAL